MEFLKKYNLPDPVCKYKWGWSTIRLFEGTTNSCHRVKSDSITPETYANFHNTPSKISDRIKMLNGQWPGNGCEYCKDLELAGAKSDRTDINEGLLDVPVNTSTTEVHLIPTMVEVYFNNLCNLGCIYCGAKYSTVWEVEDVKFGLADSHTLQDRKRNKEQYPAMLAAHWEWLKNNAHGITQYNILGGEPFFQPEFEQNIEFFENNPCPNLRFTIFSNLKVSKDKMKRILDKVESLRVRKHIKQFQIVCSLDCWGPEQEYIRTGLNMKKWEENFNILLNDYPNFTLHIHSTLISLTMQTLHELVNKVTEWNKLRYVQHSISFADGQPNMHVGIFPDGHFKKQFKCAIKFTDTNEKKEWLAGFEKRVNAQKYNPDLVQELKETLDAFDKRRGTDWRKLWPWLDQYEL
jgi:organic radical activating enzyme